MNSIGILKIELFSSVSHLGNVFSYLNLSVDQLITRILITEVLPATCKTLKVYLLDYCI